VEQQAHDVQGEELPVVRKKPKNSVKRVEGWRRYLTAAMEGQELKLLKEERTNSADTKTYDAFQAEWGKR